MCYLCNCHFSFCLSSFFLFVHIFSLFLFPLCHIPPPQKRLLVTNTWQVCNITIPNMRCEQYPLLCSTVSNWLVEFLRKIFLNFYIRSYISCRQSAYRLIKLMNYHRVT
jgi:hypothetical protein